MRNYVFLLALIAAVMAVDKSKFRTCSQTGFCKRTRSEFTPQDYEVDMATFKFDQASSAATVQLKNGHHPLQDPLLLSVNILVNNVARITVRDPTTIHPRFEVPDVLEPAGLKPGLQVTWKSDGSGFTASWADYDLQVVAVPFVATLSQGGKTAVVVNSRNLMQFEQHRKKNPKPEDEAAALPDAQLKFPYDVDNMWEESFSSHKDTKPRGPSAVAMDAGFPYATHVYGIPEHATDFSLKNTDGGEGAYSDPFRLYNLDVFEYELDVPMALYGAVPFMIAHGGGQTSALLWLNAAETFIDVSTKEGKNSHWISESGIIDMFLMTHRTPAPLFFAYASLTGFQALPPKFAIAYHQCRWNYKSEEDSLQVNAGFDEHDIPYDVLWLDIEHTDGKRYFTWDKYGFQTPEDMISKLAATGRKTVTIVDPHIKRDKNYFVHKESEEKGLYVKTNDNKDFDGWCWPGSSSYLDFFRPEVREYWVSLFSYDKYIGSTPDLFVWNDMNEPSVFNGPEVTMPKDNLHVGGKWEHRDVHNMYGFYHHWATEQGQLARDDKQVRPFVLTRSFFAGSQRSAAVWTGDNEAKWTHLAAATPMLLSLGVAGITFSGADVGGFFGNPEVELLVRWYQAAAFQPFFRGHAHVDAARREPWLFGEPHTSHLRTAIRSRYQILPYLYTLFHESSATGMPVMRPLWVEFPEDQASFAYDKGFLLGNALLVFPVVTKSQWTTPVYFPGHGTTWFDVITGFPHKGGNTATVKSPIDKIPVFQRSGTIVSRRLRARRSSQAMARDPYTLVVALDTEYTAAGTLYTDDGVTFDYAKGAFVHRLFRFQDRTLSASEFFKGTGESGCTVERVVVYGAPSTTSAVLTTADGQKTNLEVSEQNGGLVIRKPDALIAQDWAIELIE